MFPASVASLEINGEVGHVPVNKVLLAVAAALEELAGAVSGASSPGETTLVSPVLPQAVSYTHLRAHETS